MKREKISMKLLFVLWFLLLSHWVLPPIQGGDVNLLKAPGNFFLFESSTYKKYHGPDSNGIIRPGIAQFWKKSELDYAELHISDLNNCPDPVADFKRNYFFLLFVGYRAPQRLFSFTGLELGDIKEKYKTPTVSVSSKWNDESTDFMRKAETNNEDLPSLPVDLQKAQADQVFFYRNFSIHAMLRGPQTNNRFEATDLLCIETKARIDIYRTDEGAQKILRELKGNSGLIEKTINGFKSACKEFDYKKALNFLDALKKEIQLQGGKILSGEHVSVLEEIAAEFEKAVRFLIKPTFPHPVKEFKKAVFLKNDRL